jgi:hypothetical protein
VRTHSSCSAGAGAGAAAAAAAAAGAGAAAVAAAAAAGTCVEGCVDRAQRPMPCGGQSTTGPRQRDARCLPPAAGQCRGAVVSRPPRSRPSFRTRGRLRILAFSRTSGRQQHTGMGRSTRHITRRAQRWLRLCALTGATFHSDTVCLVQGAWLALVRSHHSQSKSLESDNATKKAPEPLWKPLPSRWVAP